MARSPKDTIRSSMIWMTRETVTSETEAINKQLAIVQIEIQATRFYLMRKESSDLSLTDGEFAEFVTAYKSWSEEALTQNLRKLMIREGELMDSKEELLESRREELCSLGTIFLIEGAHTYFSIVFQESIDFSAPLIIPTILCVRKHASYESPGATYLLLAAATVTQ
jgi:DNA-binding transcriptional regulator YbjK